MTLIEVLIASMILFMAVGLSASAFRQSALLQNKVMVQLEREHLKDTLMPWINFNLERGVFHGEYSQENVKASWQTELKSSEKFVNFLNNETGESSYGEGSVNLFEVTITANNWDSWSVTYDEVIWLP